MIALFLGLILTIEIVRWLPMRAAFWRLAQTSARAGQALRRRASDHWKERAIAAIAGRLFLTSLRTGALLAAAALPILAVLLLDKPFGLASGAMLASWRARLILLAFAIGYIFLRRVLDHGLKPAPAAEKS